MNGFRTLALNVVSFFGTAVASNYFGWHLDPVYVAGIIAGLNILKRYLAPSTGF